MTRRTCRACGCWELEACDGGCSWIAADRCSACPEPRPLILPINAAHVEAAQLVTKMSYGWNTVNDEPVVREMRQAVEFPHLIIMTTTCAGALKAREIYVGALQVPNGAAAAVAELLNERKEAA